MDRMEPQSSSHCQKMQVDAFNRLIAEYLSKRKVPVIGSKCGGIVGYKT